MTCEHAEEVATALLYAGAFLIDTHDGFQHTSGRLAPVYVDVRKILGLPFARSVALDVMCGQVTRAYGSYGPDAFAGGETAGIPYAAFMAAACKPGFGLPMVYVRKKPKGHGRGARIEGHLRGEAPDVALVEDLATDGASKIDFIDALRDAGARVTNVFTVLAYGQKAIDEVAAHGAVLWPCCTMDDVLTVGQRDGWIVDHEARAAREFLSSQLA